MHKRAVKRYITVDLGFPSRKWKGADDREIRKGLSEIVETDLLCCIHRLKKDKVKVDQTSLLRDFNRAKQDFLRTT